MKRGSKVDEIMTIVFLLLVFVAVVLLLFVGRSYFLVLAGGAIVLRIVQYILRFFK